MSIRNGGSPICGRRGLFDRAQLERSLARHQRGEVDIASNIFRWISTELWFQALIDGDRL